MTRKNYPFGDFLTVDPKPHKNLHFQRKFSPQTEKKMLQMRNECI